MKPIKAIINTRVSTAEQLSNNSLNRQQESVEKAAAKLNAIIPEDGKWSGSVSSKAGTNVTRKDLLEMLEYCKAHKDVKYAIFDEYDRYMRSVNEGPYFEVMFQQYGVKVWYAAETDAFNGDDAMAKFMRSMSAYRAEGSNEERQRKSIHGHEKAIREGRYTFHPKPGYTKGSIDGVHVPDPITFKPLQKAFREVLSGIYTSSEALQRLNQSDFSKIHAPWKMDKFRAFAIDPYYCGRLVMDRQVKATNERGMHKAMLTVTEHEQLITIFTGSIKHRGPKKQYNPNFPMNKIMLCDDCGGEVKFTGSVKNNGYAKKTVKYYYKYHCRGCGKSYHRADVHAAIEARLHEVTLKLNEQKELTEALATVWLEKQKDKIGHIKAMEKRLEERQATKSNLVLKLADSPAEYSLDFQEAIDKVKAEIEAIEVEIHEHDGLPDDLVDFVKFALEYTNDLAADWWTLNHEDRVRCQELIFPGGITFNSQKKVGTHRISPIYTLQTNKKALRFDRKALMVELAGTAPASAGLSLADHTTGLVRFVVLGTGYRNEQTSQCSNPNLSN